MFKPTFTHHFLSSAAGKILLLGLLFAVFFQGKNQTQLQPLPVGKCKLDGEEFTGYSFILPEIVEANGAYAPFLLHFKGKYERYFEYDIQKRENLLEWNERFCEQCDLKDIEQVVYKSLGSKLNDLRWAAENKETKFLSSFSGNTFAEAIVRMGCHEVVDYLDFAIRCEPYATRDVGWREFRADTVNLNRLIRNGYAKVLSAESHFLKMRYAYQIVRLSHYAGRYEQTLRLYTDVCKKIDFRKPSIIFYWMMGHQAGALQKLGRNAEAAYRFSLVFKNCPSKRVQAYRSFIVNNEDEWKATLAYCKNNSERANLHIMRIGADSRKQMEDLEEIYTLDPSNPMLDVLLVGEMQEIESVLLRTRFTNMKHPNAPSKETIRRTATHLIELRRFVLQAMKAKQLNNPLLWEASEGYLACLEGDFYQCNKTFAKLEKSLNKYRQDEAIILKQVQHWDLVARIRQIKPNNVASEEAAYALQSMESFAENPDFQAYYSDFLATAYQDSGRPGKALAFAFNAKAIRYNPTTEVLDDMIRATLTPIKSSVENAITTDSVQLTIADDLISMKAELFFQKGELEAAFEIFKKLSPYRLNDPTFTPFKETLKDCVHCPQADSLTFSRRNVVRQMLKYQQAAKAAEALGKPVAAYYNYLIGLAYYNTSYFGHAWNVMDRFRSGSTWEHLSEGPVLPYPNAPLGNKENLNLDLAYQYFVRCIETSKNPEMAARGAFMAARCQQKQYFCSPQCSYKIGSKTIPVLPDAYRVYSDYFLQNFQSTKFYKKAIEECTWMGAYSRQ